MPTSSNYDPPLRQQVIRPGCQFESVIRQRGGEPDLEKTQQAAHEQQKLLKKPTKDIVSDAIVSIPATFTKPLDYSVELLLRTDQHPTLREYVSLPAQ